MVVISVVVERSLFNIELIEQEYLFIQLLNSLVLLQSFKLFVAIKCSWDKLEVLIFKELISLKIVDWQD